jgi:protein disulfide-isomerase A6
VADAFVGQPVIVAKVDADKYREIGTRFGVNGFPTLKFFPAKSTNAKEFNGRRSVEDIISFIAKEARKFLDE